MYGLSEVNRKLECLLVFGRIVELDESNRKLRVEIDTEDEEYASGWLPWPADIGRNYIRWRPMRENTQVLIACPSGELGNAQIVGTLYSTDINSSMSEPERDVIEFTDGAVLEYNSGNSSLLATLPEGGQAHIIAPTKITLETPELHCTGNILANGDIHSDGSIDAIENISAGSDISAGGDVSDSIRSMSGDRSIYDGHTHPHGDPIVGVVNEKQG